MRDSRTQGADPAVAVAELVRQHLPLARHAVASLAGRLPRYVNIDDLTSAALLGLTQAARSYAPELGVPFARHASNRIRGALVDELRSMDWASRSVRSRARDIDATADRLASRLRRSPSAVEIGRELGLGADEVRAVRAEVERAVVIHYDAFVAGDGPEAVLPVEQRSPDVVLVEREREAYLRDAIRCLPERLRAVVEGYFFEERPMQELAAELGVSESRISQMRAEALTWIGESLRRALDGEEPATGEGVGRAAARRASYYAAVATASDFRSRLVASSTEVDLDLTHVVA